jgi:hypothetical protein
VTRVDDPSGLIVFADGSISEVIPSSLPQVWEITEANAAQYGFEWQVAHDSIVGEGWRRVRHGLGSRTSFGDLEPSGKRLLAFDLERIEMELTYWIHNPAGSGYVTTYRFIGDGTLVPEPTAVWHVAINHGSGFYRFSEYPNN